MIFPRRFGFNVKYALADWRLAAVVRCPFMFGHHRAHGWPIQTH
jgi:hypothetical protein